MGVGGEIGGDAIARQRRTGAALRQRELRGLTRMARERGQPLVERGPRLTDPFPRLKLLCAAVEPQRTMLGRVAERTTGRLTLGFIEEGAQRLKEGADTLARALDLREPGPLALLRLFGIQPRGGGMKQPDVLAGALSMRERREGGEQGLPVQRGAASFTQRIAEQMGVEDDDTRGRWEQRVAPGEVGGEGGMRSDDDTRFGGRVLRAGGEAVAVAPVDAARPRVGELDAGAGALPGERLLTRERDLGAQASLRAGGPDRQLRQAAHGVTGERAIHAGACGAEPAMQAEVVVRRGDKRERHILGGDSGGLAGVGQHGADQL